MLALRTSALRPLLPAILALVGTAASFGITAAPARAAAPGAFYTVTLAVPLAAPAKMVEGETLWSCAGSECSAARDTSRPAVVCARLARKVGQVTSFVTPKGEMPAEDLARCNTAAS
jgi:hypothetical protein